MAETILLTLKEAAEQMRVSSRTIRRLIESGDLVAIPVRRSLRIRREDLCSYVDGLARLSHTAKCAGPDVLKEVSTCRESAIRGTRTASIVGLTPRLGGRRTPTQAEKELDVLLEQATVKKQKRS